MSLAEQLIRWRRELHQYPELSLQEVDTTARIRDWLQSGGISLLPYELKTGAVAEVGSGNKVIALRADIDALPIEEAASVPFRSLNAGVMHACGHDIHTSVILGAALLLKQREAQLAGRVRILFQPAEESFGGAKTLIRAGVLEGVSAIFGMHNEPGLSVGEFATRGGAFYANVDRFVFKVTGKGAHAARPHEGKDAILLASQLVTLLQSAGRERQATWSFAHAQIHAARREGGQHIEVFRHFVRAVVLEHDAAGTDANPAGLAEDPGDRQFRRRAGKLLGIVVFGYPETVIAPGFRLLRQR